MNNETSNRRERKCCHLMAKYVSQNGNISNGRKINIKACLKLDSSPPFMITLGKNMSLKRENVNSKKKRKLILFNEFSKEWVQVASNI